MKAELYISVDIESSGPVVGTHSMLSLGACVVGYPEQSFYAEIKPISAEFVPEALSVSGFNLDELQLRGRDPREAMNAFRAWILEHTGKGKPVFVGFNASYDWQFVNWYLLTFGNYNPFGFGAVDIKSYYMGKRGVGWFQSTSSQLPPDYVPDSPQTHNALDDARAQASIFEKLLAGTVQ